MFPWLHEENPSFGLSGKIACGVKNSDFRFCISLKFCYVIPWNCSTGKIMPYLLFDENGNRNYIQLERGLMLTLGCTPDCNIILPDSSRSHFRIFDDDSGVWFVENLASASGDALKTTSLGNGDQITLSGMTITYLDSIEGTGARPFSGTISLSAGQKIRGYTVSNLLNRGVGNRFYLVKDQKDKSFALKVFDKSLSAAETEGFFNEIDTVRFAALPGIAPYHACGVIHHNCYYVTDYYEHPDLAFRISSKAPMKHHEALGILRSIVEILRTAYDETGVFHGALTPSKVLFDSDEKMMLGEYGLFVWKSLVLNGGRACTSPWYISPEEITGGEISLQTDMYSLGVMLFQMLTGVLPFHSRDEEELLGMHVYKTFPLPSERNPNVSVSSGTLQMLLKMTARNPADRFRSWDELLSAISYAEATRQLEKRPAAIARSASTEQNSLRLKSRINPNS